MAALFISDLHLDPERPAATGECLEFLAGAARDAEHLYILGDLFEAWIGDDDDAPWLAPVLGAIAELTASGVPCSLMHGNRDFLVGERFAAATGVRLLDEHAVVELSGRKVLLTHGDLLCTDDTRYMTLRAELRDPDWQRSFLAKPLAERRTIASELRALSQTEISSKSADIMDVNQQTVEETMRRFGVDALLHGHTHRPGIHRFDLDGRPAVRVVLGDWYSRGSYVAWDQSGPIARPLGSRPIRD